MDTYPRFFGAICAELLRAAPTATVALNAALLPVWETVGVPGIRLGEFISPAVPASGVLKASKNSERQSFHALSLRSSFQSVTPCGVFALAARWFPHFIVSHTRTHLCVPTPAEGGL